MRCPFGCRQHHRQTSSAQRCAEYYGTLTGRFKKQQHNQRRLRLLGNGAAVVETPLILDNTILRYLQSTLGMIEGRKITGQEIHSILEKQMRQHSLANDKGSDYRDGQEREKAP